MKISALVSWPSAPLTDSLVRKALETNNLQVELTTDTNVGKEENFLQWSTYDDLDHELSSVNRNNVLSSSYTFRKALIRKHFLSRIIQNYLAKRPHSILRDAVPKTHEIEISFADELDEMWTDELWELGQELEKEEKWWILKPGMADRGMGIRLFRTKQQIHEIFESFEEEEEEEEEESSENDSTAVMASQLRHFVIQEYIARPLLLDPNEAGNLNSGAADFIPRKFHLRAYCVAFGALDLYLYTRVLALFSSSRYTHPSDTPFVGESSQVDLRPHLTNSALQTDLGESNVRLMDELEGCHILSSEDIGETTITRLDIDVLISQMSVVLAETYKAALQNPIHFQVQPNAFELFGVDFLVEHNPNDINSPFQVKLLEINSEPAIELTGPRLTWILEDLFASIAKFCVKPFFEKSNAGINWEVGETRDSFLKCLGEVVRVPS